jgi:hypothetical protein
MALFAVERRRLDLDFPDAAEHLDGWCVKSVWHADHSEGNVPARSSGKSALLREPVVSTS